jgi:hypothetical protein
MNHHPNYVQPASAKSSLLITSSEGSDSFAAIANSPRFDRGTFIAIESMRDAIASVINELKQRLEHDGCSLEASFYRAASGTLNAILKSRFDLELSPVINRNKHTFLRWQVEKRRAVCVDPTIRQFIKPELWDRVPLVFVGSRSEMNKILISCNVDSRVVNGYFRDLSVDSITPVSPPILGLHLGHNPKDITSVTARKQK